MKRETIVDPLFWSRRRGQYAGGLQTSRVAHRPPMPGQGDARPRVGPCGLRVGVECQIPAARDRRLTIGLATATERQAIGVNASLDATEAYAR